MICSWQRHEQVKKEETHHISHIQIMKYAKLNHQLEGGRWQQYSLLGGFLSPRAAIFFSSGEGVSNLKGTAHITNSSVNDT
jgi:cellobiose phosphorylase